MGYFSQLALDIQEMLFEGHSEAEIAERLNLSIEEVEAQICMMEEADYEPEYDGQPDEAQEWHDFDPDC